MKYSEALEKYLKVVEKKKEIYGSKGIPYVKDIDDSIISALTYYSEKEEEKPENKYNKTKNSCQNTWALSFCPKNMLFFSKF